MRNIACRVCGCTKQEYILRDYRIMDRTWNLIKCPNCGLVSTDPLPDDHILELIYADGYGAAADDLSAVMMFNLRMKGFARKLRKIVQSGNRVLDVGAGKGHWVNLLRRQGFEAFGVDPYASEVPGRFILTCSLQDAPFEKRSFDLITCMHVLEHMKDPVGSLKEADAFLKTGGFLLMEVPNINSLAFKFFKKRWFPLDDIPAHINHFDKNSLLSAVQKAGKYLLIGDSGFSLKHSPSILANTIFPNLCPRAVRKRYSGYHPVSLKVIYALLQAALLPVCWGAGLGDRGEVIRLVFKKLPEGE